MPTWSFKAAMPRHARDASTTRWYWQIDTDNSFFAVTSPKLFSTLDACIADARGNGFRGEVATPERLEGNTVISCEEGDYVHAVVQESVRDRANPTVA